jgi:hypothetical protein
LRRIHDGLRATRGAAAAIADLDADRRMVTFAGVGNISGVIVTDEGTRTMVSHHGVLGHEAGRFHEFQYPWPPHASVVLHSDGISTHWNLASHPGLLRRHPQFSAAMLFRDSRRGRDDATAVVVREAA